ncbi:MAG: tetratricopeptide repeat protein [Gammaproteobacteria bacterium]|nr:tetratricopeptide repeat protein [Gammaproteobacteria bacterium]
MQRARFVFLLFFILLPVTLTAAAASPAADFDDGTRAFNQKNYRQALEYFKQAESAGMRDARLDYNLGSVYYRLGQYDSSRHYFEKLVDHPSLGGLAYYNLGLIAHRSGDSTAAIELFAKTAQTTQDAKLKALANKQIETLAGRQQKDWFAFVSASYGYDSNITLLPSTAASDQSDDFLQTLALAEWTLQDNKTDSIHLSAMYLSSDYIGSSSLDDDSLTLGAEYRDRIDEWKLSYLVELTQSTFSGDDYLATTGLVVGARTTLSERRELRLRLTLEDISERSNDFAFLDGIRSELSASYRLKIEKREYRFEYGLEFNDRENTATESFSPTRHRGRFRYIDRITDKVEIGAWIEFRESDYKSVPAQSRNDERWRLRLEGKYRLGPTWTTQAELTYTDNKSSEQTSEYHKYQLLVSINAPF